MEYQLDRSLIVSDNWHAAIRDLRETIRQCQITREKYRKQVADINAFIEQAKRCAENARKLPVSTSFVWIL